ncbi:olfactory receptor 11A1-like [Gastrophryne carolinensis]
MFANNHSKVTEFLLLGFGDLDTFNIVFFIVFLIIFLFTIAGNIVIIIIVLLNPLLQFPMYYFLCHLSVTDLLTSVNILPNMLGTFLFKEQSINFIGCITQFYIFSGAVITECFLLSVMSYDRYLAICNPLRYSIIMDIKLCVILSAWPWLLGFTWNLSGVIPVSEFDFCANNTIDHFYCDFLPLQKLSCSDTSFVEFEIFIFAMPIYIMPFGLIVLTYVYIFHTIVSIPSTTGKQKAFSTCSSHLMVVGTFYGTLIAKYMTPSHDHSVLLVKMLSLLHTVFTPFFNPIIYSLRNQDIRIAFTKMLKLLEF